MYSPKSVMFASRNSKPEVGHHGENGFVPSNVMPNSGTKSVTTLNQYQSRKDVKFVRKSLFLQSDEQMQKPVRFNATKFDVAFLKLPENWLRETWTLVSANGAQRCLFRRCLTGKFRSSVRRDAPKYQVLGLLQSVIRGMRQKGRGEDDMTEIWKSALSEMVISVVYAARRINRMFIISMGVDVHTIRITFWKTWRHSVRVAIGEYISSSFVSSTASPLSPAWCLSG